VRYVDALNQGDANAAAAFFSDNAILVTSAPCLITTLCKDRAAILARSQLVVAQHLTQTLIGSPQAGCRKMNSAVGPASTSTSWLDFS
jgi:hypothetical protein